VARRPFSLARPRYFFITFTVSSPSGQESRRVSVNHLWAGALVPAGRRRARVSGPAGRPAGGRARHELASWSQRRSAAHREVTLAVIFASTALALLFLFAFSHFLFIV
jgi:hypothetical protein